MIAADEPTELSHMPQAFVFEHWDARLGYSIKQEACVSKSIRRVASVAFEGSHGRAWLFDPCSMALNSGLHAARMAETSADHAARAARRKAKAQLAEEDAKARAVKSQTW